jgi:histidyl-tRNA synthetase
MFDRPRGTRDILPDEMEARRVVEWSLRETFERFGYREIQTPTFEHLELITAKSGEEITDHLYSFKDKSNRKLALRPELSAPTIRLYVNEQRNRPKPRKLYYFENCFRYERPQKGRYREFWQAGVELLGSSRPEAETEVVALAVKCLENVGLKEYGLIIGNRGIFRAIFNHYNTSEDVQNLILSQLDKKDIQFSDLDIPKDAKNIAISIIKPIAMIKESLVNRNNIRSRLQKILKRDFKIIEPELKGFEEFLDLLGVFGVSDCEIDFLIARGLDYYTGMVFEIFAEGLGAQDQICGGGTYSLVKLIGGGDVPSCGFAFGFDRLMLSLDAQGKLPKRTSLPRLIVVPATRKMLNRAINITSVLRNKITCDLELMGRKLEKSLSYANSEGIPYVLIVSEEAKGDGLILKDMHTGEQKIIKISEVADAIG